MVSFSCVGWQTALHAANIKGADSKSPSPLFQLLYPLPLLKYMLETSVPFTPHSPSYLRRVAVTFWLSRACHVECTCVPDRLYADSLSIHGSGDHLIAGERPGAKREPLVISNS